MNYNSGRSSASFSCQSISGVLGTGSGKNSSGLKTSRRAQGGVSGGGVPVSKNRKAVFAKEEEKERPTIISGMKIWKQKRENQESFKYLNNNKIVQGTSEYFAKEDFKANLEIEKNIIDNSVMHYNLSGDLLEKVNLELDYNVQKAYENLINYYKVNNLLPSLAYYDMDLVNISKDYINSILDVLDSIKNEEVLSKEQRNISKLGTIHRLDGDKEILLTPLHPINVSYQLMINNMIDDEEVEDNILKLLSSRYLMPYLYTPYWKPT